MITTESSVGPRAKDIKTTAAGWIERRDRADWTDHNQAELDAWLAKSPAHLLAYHRAASIWISADRLVALRQPPSAPMEKKEKLHSSFGVKAITAMIVASVLGAATLFFTQSKEQTFETPVGGHRLVTLADGTLIELNTNTLVRANLKSGHRLAILERGEAYFRVAHDVARPFEVTVGPREINVLGTEFMVRKDQDMLRVALFNGRVEIGAAADIPSSSIVVLKPGDVLTATARTLSVAHSAKADLANLSSWRRGVLVFDHTALSKVADEYNRYNQQKIVIADEASSRLKMSGTMPTNNLAEFKSIARKVFNLQVRSYGNEIAISR